MSYVRSRVNLLDTWIDQVDIADTGVRLESFIRSGIPHQIVPANLDFLRLCVRDSSFREIVNTSDLVVPDGMPLVWASRRSGTPLPRRIAGVDLMLEASRLAAERGYRIFLLGGGVGVAAQTAEILRERFPGLNVTGTHAPSQLPMSPEDEDSVLEMIGERVPDMLFVAFGAPLQERWVRTHMEALRIPICAGVGGAFDMISGRVPRAPEWMQRSGLEWFYRLSLEPRRLWKRYFVHDLPVFMRLMIRSGSAPAPVSVTEIGAPDLSAALPGAGTLTAHE